MSTVTVSVPDELGAVAGRLGINCQLEIQTDEVDSELLNRLLTVPRLPHDLVAPGGEQ